MAATGLLLIGAAAAPFSSWAGLAAGGCAGGVVALNLDFYRFLRRRGLGFAASAFPLHLLYFVCCGVSVVIALVRWHVLERSHRATAQGRVDRGARSISRTGLESVGTEAETMDGSIKVAVVQGDRRRGAVAQAFGLIADDVRDRVSATGAAIVAPTLDELGRGWASTDRDTLSATIDALLAAGAGSVDVAAGRGDPACLDRLGYRAETSGRPVSYHDLNAEADAWIDHRDPERTASDRVAGGRGGLPGLALDRPNARRISPRAGAPQPGDGRSPR